MAMGHIRAWIGAGLLFAALVAPPCQALDPLRATSQYQLQSWTTLDGLPSDTITQVLERREGDLLLCSYFAPPVLFDGVGVEPLDPALEHSPPFPFAAYQDPAGDLWLLGKEFGLARWRGGQPLERLWEGDAPQRRVNVVRWVDRQLLLGTDDGLWALDAQRSAVRAGLAGREVVSLLLDKAGSLWAGTDQGLWLRQGEEWAASDAPGLSRVKVWSLLEDRQGALWVGTRGRALLQRSVQGWRSFGRSDGFAHDVVRALAEDPQGVLWAATAGAGLARGSQARFQHLGGAEGLGSDSALSVIVDRQGTLWSGTAGGGLARLSDSAFVNWTPAQGLASGFVWGVLRAADGSYFVAGNNGVSRLQDGRAAAVPLRFDGPAPMSFSMVEDHDGSLLVGTVRGLLRMRDGQLEVEPDAPPAAPIRVLQLDPELGLAAGGEGLYWRRGTAWEADAEPTLATARVHRLGRWEQTLWVGSSLGLLLRDARAARWVSDPAMGSVRDAWRDPDGRIWMAARGLWWAQQGQPARRLPVVHPDRHWVLHSVRADGLGGLWASTNQGLRRWSLSELGRYASAGGELPRSRLFDRQDGLVGSELNGGSQNSVLSDLDGSLWFAGASGVSRLFPERLRDSPAAISASIRYLEAGGVRHRGAATLRLPAGERQLRIRYTALPAALGAQARFRYRLQPLHASWVEAGREREALLAGLAPGRYRFEVQAFLPDQPSPPATTALELLLPPHWHERADVQLSGGLLLALAALGLPLWHIRALRRQRAALLDEVAEKTAALERLAHSDSLTGLPNRRVLDQALARAWQEASDRPLSMLMVDIDHFKAYNDNLGHPEGDRCLAAVARAIQRSTRGQDDLAARIGGEEFAVLLPGAGARAAHKVGERIRQELAGMALSHPAPDCAAQVTVSVGYAQREPSMAAAASLIAAADAALYAAKRGGRDRVAGPPAAQA
jgi:diguanylate cyclase (GGDEF)-like protein